MRHSSLTPGGCRGTTLLEVMIAAVVIGLALLGVAAMQVSALQGSSHAQFRSKATDLAGSLADRMRANQTARDAYNTAEVDSCAAPPLMCAMTCSDKDQMVDGCPASDLRKPGNCSPSQLAIYDVWEVRCLSGIRNTLPGGTLSVTCTETPCTDNSPFQIVIAWQAQKSASDDAEKSTTQDVKITIIPGGRP